MIGYVCVGTNKFDEAAAFYDSVFAVLGHKRMMGDENFIAWGEMDGAAAGFGLTLPHDKNPATVGNGTMVAFAADSPEVVDKVHAKALELGATDEGAPGPRDLPGFYAGYFRDLDGNKLNVFHMDMSKMGADSSSGG